MFTAPASNYDYDSNQDNMDMDVDDLWILLWIFKFQERFRQSDVAIDTLISFFSLVLKDANSHRFKKFSLTVYKASKILDIKKKSKLLPFVLIVISCMILHQ